MLNHLDIFKIRILTEVAKTESVLKTSQALRVTPSAISQNIKAMESAFGQQLFIRIGKRLVATHFALDLAERSSRFFDEMESIVSAGISRRREITVGSPPIFGSTYLLEKIDLYQKLQSDVRFVLTFMDTRRLKDLLLDSKVDFAFLDGGSHLRGMASLAIQEVYQEELALCCSAEFARAAKLDPRATFQSLQSLPHIPYNKGREAIHKWYEHHFRRVPEFPFSIAVDNPQGLLDLVLKNRGLAVLPKNLIARNLKNGKVVIIDGPRGRLVNSIVLAQLNQRIPTAAEKKFLRFLRQ